MGKELDKAVEEINRQYGKGAVMRLGANTKLDVKVISTGSLSVDVALGIGGVPRGRIVEVYGTECLDAETFISYSTTVGGRRSNGKGGTIRRLHERFHKLPPSGEARGKTQRKRSINAEFFAPSMNDEGRIVLNRIIDVINSGKKQCFHVRTLSGEEILATAKHEFFTGRGYALLADLKIGDTVHIHNNTPFTVSKYKDSNKNRIDLYVKNHPIAGTKVVNSISNRTTGERTKYTYHRLARARAVVEAKMNDLCLDDYVTLLNSGSIEGLFFLSKNQHVHHKDENEGNDVYSNLAVLTAENHGRLHATERHNNLRFMTVPDTIVEITDVGERETYDIRMEAPLHNFIANRFVVHNSGGKTTLTLHIIAQAQKLGGKAAFIDAEHALDPSYARKLGVNTDELLISQPNNGEEALEIVEKLVKSNEMDVIVVDSVAALVPRAELEGDMGDPQMGLQARLMSQGLRKLTAVVSKSHTCLIFINQVRDKIGVMFGSPETTTGGRALKFYSSVRLDIRRSGTVKTGDVKTANTTKVKIVKNKCAAPFRECEIEIIFGEGICNEKDLITLGVEKGLVEKSGAWYQFGGQKFQGEDSLREALKNNATVSAALESALRTAYFGEGK